MRRRGRRGWWIVAAAAVAWSGAPAPSDGAPAQADPLSAPDAGVPFDPPPLPAETFDILPPSTSPAQVRMLEGADGVDLYTETWLPGPLDGNVPPSRLPVVLVYTPYATRGSPDFREAVDLLVPRGFAVTFAHVRGSGGSGGCIAQLDDHEVDDGARIVEDAGLLAPWASGAVGMYGVSYPGGTQLATATGPDRERLAPLEALVIGAPAASAYEFYNHDGVPHFLSGPGNTAAYVALLSNPQDSPERLFERIGCQPEVFAGTVLANGDYNAFHEERDHTRHLERLEAATLMVHGTADRRVPPITQAGLFDRIPDTTPRHGLFGVFDHELPDRYGFNPGLTSPRTHWERADWDAMVVSWFDRYLRGVDNGVASWPAVQVQGTDGQWRTASDWPAVPGPERVLPLGPGGALGASGPTGTTTYLELPSPEMEHPALPTDLPGTTAVFVTAPVTERLELVGTPRLDLWVQLALPDSHVTARLEAVDAAGERVTFESRTTGARSAQHLLPLDADRFRQRGGLAAPVLQPFLLPLRFDPIDLVVPAGGRLRLTIAGASILFDGLDGVQQGLGAIFQGPSWPSLVAQPVTILHDAAHPSALRITLPEAGSQLLDVREQDQTGPLGQQPGATVAVDGGLGALPAAASPSPGGPLPATGGGGAAPLLPLAALAIALALWARRRHAV